jgi:P-type Cu+ transporter
MAKDPVCGMTVDEKALLKSTHEEKNYVFCSASCKAKFDRDPGQYAPAGGGEAKREERT